MVPAATFFAVVAVVNLVGSDTPTEVGLAAFVGCVVLAVTGWTAIGVYRSRVVADATGLSQANGRHVSRWPWSEVMGFEVADDVPSSVRVSPASLSASWRPRTGDSTPIVRLRNGTIARLTVLTSTRRADGFTLGGASPAEVHAAMLARYHAAITDGTPTFTPAPST